MNTLIKVVSTFFYLGYLPKMPGTFGTFGALLFYCLLVKMFHFGFSELGLTTLIIIILSIISSHYSIKIFESDDPKKVVIDEVAGYFVVLLFVPFTIGNLLCGFVLFRLFDVWKPFPLNKLENLHGGLGITLDDVGAGIVANLILRLIAF
tara:strand:- start:167 stop:616 length:450 start_codon:yes stop_codon:yes gene_type:complete